MTCREFRFQSLVFRYKRFDGDLFARCGIKKYSIRLDDSALQHKRCSQQIERPEFRATLELDDPVHLEVGQFLRGKPVLIVRRKLIAGHYPALSCPVAES